MIFFVVDMGYGYGLLLTPIKGLSPLKHFQARFKKSAISNPAGLCREQSAVYRSRSPVRKIYKQVLEFKSFRAAYRSNSVIKKFRFANSLLGPPPIHHLPTNDDPPPTTTNSPEPLGQELLLVHGIHPYHPPPPIMVIGDDFVI